MDINKIIKQFSVESLTAFLKAKIHSFKAEVEEYDYLFEDNYKITDSYTEIQKIGEAELSTNEDIIVITAQTEKELTSRSGKKLQYEIAKKILKNEDSDSAFFIFYDEMGNFRFSFIRANYEGIKRDYTTFKRYTYFVSPKQTNKTFINQLNSCNFDSIDSIQQVFSVEPLTKDFYSKLQSWYFWAIHQVTFPSEPTISQYFAKTGDNDPKKFDAYVLEHKAQNVIRLLTRLLFVWFIKQKKLIPDELFDLKSLQENILKNITPYHDENGLFAEESKESIYYKAILQNLFFATLNCPIEAEASDTRKRSFRLDDTEKSSSSRKSDFGVTFLMRYKEYFKDPEAFLEMVNKTVPFLNGGLFECLDIRGEGEKKDDRVWIDGFSENLPKEHKLIVPDYLFFGRDEKIDLSNDLGVKNKKTREVVVNGLINLLESYNFTIDENEPNDIEVALDPELLGKVFENLLASYNPETKTTARKQTGSFYTPREIVSYMVDESLIAHLKNAVKWEGYTEEDLDKKLHELVAYNSENPFVDQEDLTIEIIHALDSCKILDPACGSGAFPMGILQKMVHILQKLDPENKHWHEIQYQKALKQTQGAFKIKDKKEREEYLLAINEAFDENMNQPDYARKLFLIENCIYGVDIQPIAAQISKLRFFISLVVEQKIIREKVNFGIRPLPNLETKFVTANTLIGIEKDGDLFQTEEVKVKEQELKEVRHKLFSAKTKKTKSKYRKKDKELREEIAEVLEDKGLPAESAQKLASWDPYDQNGCSPFFDPEWMFDIKDGFDIVIGNPPYALIQNISTLDKSIIKLYEKFEVAQYKIDLYHLFIERGINLLKVDGIITYITPNTFIKNKHNNQLRKFMYDSSSFNSAILFYKQVFDSVSVDNIVFIAEKCCRKKTVKVFEIRNSIDDIKYSLKLFEENNIRANDFVFNFDINPVNDKIISQIKNNTKPLKEYAKAYFGIQTYDRTKYVSESKLNDDWQPVIDGSNISKFKLEPSKEYVNFKPEAIKSGGNPNIYNKKRIVIRQIGIFPEGAICPPKLYTLNTIYNIYSISNNVTLEYILCLINSKVLRFFWIVSNFDNKKTFPKIKKDPIENLPIKTSKKLKVIIEQIYVIVKLKNSKYFEKVIDALVFELYFTEHMRERNIDVLQFVEKDLNEVMKNRDFETLADSEKDKIIYELNSRWSNPENEIVKRVSSFKEKSPDILKVILES